MRRRCMGLPFTQSLPCGTAWGGGPLGSVEVYDHVRGYESCSVCLCWLAPCSRIDRSACKPLPFSPRPSRQGAESLGPCVAYLLRGIRVACWVLFFWVLHPRGCGGVE